MICALRFTLCLALVAGGFVSPAQAAPNFVVILTDDHGWSELSQTMDPRVPEAKSSYLETPHIDALAKAGLRFTSGYSPAPLCTPTRRSILCGTSAARSGSEFKSAWVPADHLTIPKALKSVDAAYRCAHFGKWGEQMISTPEQCGYDSSDGMTGNNTGGMPSSLHADRQANHENTDEFYTNQADPKLTGQITDAAIAFIRESVAAKRPFYVQTSYYAAHLSIVCRPETLMKYEAKGVPDRGYTPAWAAMLEELDQGVGRLLAGLEEQGVADDTYVVFTADNGGRGTVPGGDGSRLPPNHPLTGAKHSLNEGGIRVPFIVRGPGITAGATCHVPVAAYDLLPTVHDLAGGGSLPAEIDGVSLRPLLKDPQAGTIARPAGGLIFHRPGNQVSVIRQGPYKLLLKWRDAGVIASRELYDLSSDPRETGRDIASQEPDRVAGLEKTLLDYLASVNAEAASPPRRRNRREAD